MATAHVESAITDPQIAAALDAGRDQARRWHDQMTASRHGLCPAPINQAPCDMYDVYGATITGNEPLANALAATRGHVFVADDTSVEARCIRCDHAARIWPHSRVFIAHGTPCPSGDEPDDWAIAEHAFAQAETIDEDEDEDDFDPEFSDDPASVRAEIEQRARDAQAPEDAAQPDCV